MKDQTSIYYNPLYYAAEHNELKQYRASHAADDACVSQHSVFEFYGYVLDALKDELSLPEQFFTECEKRSSASKTYLFEKQEDFVLHIKWKLFAPKNLKSIVDKGVTDYDVV